MSIKLRYRELRTKLADATGRARERVAKIRATVSDFLMLDSLSQCFPCLEPAYATASGYGFVSRVSRPQVTTELSGPGQKKGSNIMHFDTGSAPPQGSPSRQILGWAGLDILMPGETPIRGERRYITYQQAQAEVTRVLSDTASSHEYITYETAKLCGQDPQVVQYTLHLIIGAMAEDYMFAPTESLEAIVLKKPEKMPKTKEELSQRVGSEVKSPSLVRALFRAIAKLWKKLTRSIEKDAINRPYFAHFYDPTKEGTGGLDILDGELKFQSALTRIKKYWEIASYYYLGRDLPRAFCALGHMLHLVQDLHVPAHVHNDIHGPTLILGKPDSLELWAAQTNYPHITRTKDESNIRIWNSKPLAPPEPDKSWMPENLDRNLSLFVHAVAVDTGRFRSVDGQGTDIDQQKTGKLSDRECFEQASYLIPDAILDSARLLVTFLDYHRRIAQKDQVSAASA